MTSNEYNRFRDVARVREMGRVVNDWIATVELAFDKNNTVVESA